MGGVAGYIGRDSTTGSRLLRQLVGAQARRGRYPGTVVGDQLGVAQRAGTRGAAAPATDDRYALALDGSLDNATELRAELVAEEYWPADEVDATDAALVLAAWRAWGDAGLARCTGRYAMIIADLAGNTLTLVRDELGIAPLFFAQLPAPQPAAPESAALAQPTGPGGTLIVASEIPALLATKLITPAADEVTVLGYLRHGDRATQPRTFYAGVSRVLPGEAVTVAADGTLTRRRYGRLRTDLDALDRRTHPVDEAARALVAAELHRAVRDRLGDGVAVPAALAGYADGRPVLAQPESAYPVELAALLGDLVEPLPGPATYAQYQAIRAAGEDATVLLDITGVRALRAAGALPVRVRDLWHRRRYGRLLRELWHEPAEAARWLWRALTRGVQRSAGRLADPVTGLLNSAWVERVGTAVPAVPVAKRLRGRVLDGLPAALEFTDRAAVGAGVAVRLPLLDAELLRTLWALDPTPSALPPLPVAPELSMPDWVAHLQELLGEVFLSASFGARGWYDQLEVLAAHRAYQAGAASADPAVFWRLASVELWLRSCVDPPGRARRAVPAAEQLPGWHPPAPAKSDYLPNPGREQVSPDKLWARYPLRVELIDAGTDLPALAAARCADFFAAAPATTPDQPDTQPWYLYVSATAVSVAQARAVPVWEVYPGAAARWLSRVAPKLLGADPAAGRWHPAAAQVAIEELGLGRLCAASVCGAFGRLLRQPDWFARVAGAQVAAFGGPGAGSAYPSNVSARLAPRRPRAVAEELSAAVRLTLPAPLVSRFGGTVLVAADERRRVVLGHDTGLPVVRLAAACAGNPLGQGREQTPFAVVTDLHKAPTADWATLNVDSRPATAAWGTPPPEPAIADLVGAADRVDLVGAADRADLVGAADRADLVGAADRADLAGAVDFAPAQDGTPALDEAPELVEEDFGGFRWEYEEPRMVQVPWRRRARNRISS